ncbi:MAG: glycosyltransferase family 2 protein [Candidatus Pacebacteria bacterium]|nr:glycosyltransferase family 2 protein [Candidatus Paceibacterota bacterium]
MNSFSINTVADIYTSRGTNTPVSNGTDNFPLISVIIPAHNSSETIGRAIKSVLHQTYPNIEIVIIDDNSIDNTKEVVETFTRNHSNIYYYALPFDDPRRFNKHGKNINAGWMARNFGFTKIKGEWITFQDADDASLLNRIEAQYNLAQKYNSNHICVDWQGLDETIIDTKLDCDKIFAEHPNIIISPKEIMTFVKKTKGIAMSLFGRFIPFEIKRMKFINKLFFASLDPYPCASNSPLFKREVIEKVKFRPRDKRIWPTFVGRGADRDFNFQVAETFKTSYAFKLPLYLWNRGENKEYREYDKYII